MNRDIEIKLYNPDEDYTLRAEMNLEHMYVDAYLTWPHDDEDVGTYIGSFEDAGACVKFVPVCTDGFDTFVFFNTHFPRKRDANSSSYTALANDLRKMSGMLFFPFFERRRYPFSLGPLKYRDTDWLVTVYPNGSASVTYLRTGVRTTGVYNIEFAYTDDDLPIISIFDSLEVNEHMLEMLIRLDKLKDDWNWFGVLEDERSPERFDELQTSLKAALSAAGREMYERYLYTDRTQLTVRPEKFKARIYGNEVTVIAKPDPSDPYVQWLSLEGNDMFAESVMSASILNDEIRVFLCAPERLCVMYMARVLNTPPKELFEDFEAFELEATSAVKCVIPVQTSKRIPAARRGR